MILVSSCSASYSDESLVFVGACNIILQLARFIRRKRGNGLKGDLHLELEEMVN